ncbi:hypothetical protein H2201_004449 [Coniosporium apollinis]|uniref:L-lactate dehydrogenase (Cytochrome) n=1 Tax=Coniosporium apollinis TaxID=61459 RepID=A0ABQ9NSJ4_9PEZI|nr:hypothetical protein H2201_004449 [Coniosporium apollinis]
MSAALEAAPSELVQYLKTVLLDLHSNPYPYVPNPPTISKRASVALIIRIQPHYSHWPPKDGDALRDSSSAPASIEEQVNRFFSQEWVQHGDPEVLFIKRAERKGDRWTSHVALPGGRRDPEDSDDQATAVRETLEEVGIDLSTHTLQLGNLPQRVVTTSWGKVPLMVLCPYVYLLTTPSPPALRLQPTEVGSCHWVSLRALLSPTLRTFELQDVSNRLAKAEMGIRRWFLRAMLGKMIFAAVRLVPSQSVYCSSIPGFIPEPPVDDVSSTSAFVGRRLANWWAGAGSSSMLGVRRSMNMSVPTAKPLLLWGLTLGIMADFLDLLPPFDASRLWTYPTFTPWDVRFAVWALSYNLRKEKQKLIAQGAHKAPAAVEEGLDPVAVRTPEPGETVGGEDREKPGEAGISGLGVGRYYGRLRREQRGSRSSAVGVMLEGYYDIVRRAVKVALVGRVSAMTLLLGPGVRDIIADNLNIVAEKCGTQSAYRGFDGFLYCFTFTSSAQRASPLLNMSKVFDYEEVAKHNTAESCWVILYGSVWDVTSFLPSHPGGSKIILQLAGTDATEEYDPIHPPGTLEESLPPSAKLGTINPSTLPKTETAPADDDLTDTGPPPLEDLLNLDDIEEAATKQISRKAWAYYFSASDDLATKSHNNTAYRQILLRPRIFRDCTHCSTATTLLGHNVNVPIYVAPAAMARLAHPDGEAGIAAACARFGAVQVVSNNASQTPEQIVAAAEPGQVFGWQLYVQTERSKSEAMLARIAKLPAYKFLVLTLDAPVPGKREHDERSKNIGANLPIRSSVQEGSASTTSPDPEAASAKEIPAPTGGVGKALFAGTAPDLTWATTLPWLEKHTTLPIVLKGVQTHEDAYIASRHPQIKAIVLSNHGGRAMDTAPPAVHTLLEIRKYCPDVFDRVEVWVDGGIKRGTDVVKALCLGAKAVGVGRAALYGLGAGGKEGVERVLEILKAETETAMRLLGVERIEELGLQHVSVDVT